MLHLNASRAVSKTTVVSPKINYLSSAMRRFRVIAMLRAMQNWCGLWREQHQLWRAIFILLHPS